MQRPYECLILRSHDHGEYGRAGHGLPFPKIRRTAFRIWEMGDILFYSNKLPVGLHGE
jgi:hypothetical protein